MLLAAVQSCGRNDPWPCGFRQWCIVLSETSSPKTTLPPIYVVIVFIANLVEIKTLVENSVFLWDKTRVGL